MLAEDDHLGRLRLLWQVKASVNSRSTRSSPEVNVQNGEIVHESFTVAQLVALFDLSTPILGAAAQIVACQSLLFDDQGSAAVICPVPSYTSTV